MAKSKTLIDSMQESGDTLGGMIEIRVDGLPYGLGTHAQWDRKLDGLLAKAVMAVQAMKGVEIGLGFQMARQPGSASHDPIHYDPQLADTPSLGFVRPTNNAGGLEAGMTNAQPIVVRAAMKPISTLEAAAGIGQSANQAIRNRLLRAQRRLRHRRGKLRAGMRRRLRNRHRARR